MKKLFWSLALVAVFGGVYWFAPKEFLPQAEVLVPLRTMATSEEMLESLESALKNDLQKTPVLIWGQWPDDNLATEALKTWLGRQAAVTTQDPAADQQQSMDPSPTNTQTSSSSAPQLWVDEQFQNIYQGRPVFLRGHEQTLRQEVQSLVQQGQRLVIVTSPIFAASLLVGTPVAALAEHKPEEKNHIAISFLSIINTDFPRRREQEELVKLPCALPHVDKMGTGILGCRILQSGRQNYRRSFPPGTGLGMIERLNAHDVLFLRAAEPVIEQN